MSLTEITVRNVRAREKPFKLADSGGLFLFVTATGSRLWRFKYRFSGKEKLLSIGPYPLVGLKNAREARDEAKRDLLRGLDPSKVKSVARNGRRSAASETFRGIAGEYVAKLEREGRAGGTMEKVHWYLSFAFPTLGDRELRSLSAADVLAVLRTIELRGRHETARKTRSTIGAVFRYAVATARAENDPTVALKGALTKPIVKPRASITDPKAFGSLLTAIWAYDGTPEVVAALKLLALLYPRPGELRQAEWSEFDLEAGIWTVPASRMKMRRPHRVPLSADAVVVFRNLHDQRITTSPLAFPSLRSATRCLSENTFNAALRRMGYTTDQATAHGFRASFSTMANESGLWNADAIERALAHVEENSARRAYARGEHWDERVRMAGWWTDWCEKLRVQAQTSVRNATGRPIVGPRPDPS